MTGTHIIILFQSTLPRGERLTFDRIDETDIPISIHAPARGATKNGVIADIKSALFQSTLPRGERLIKLWI